MIKPNRNGLRLASSLAVWMTAGLASSGSGQTIPADIRNEEVIILDAFNVTAQDGSDYISNEALSGALAGALTLETPYNMQIITGEFMKDFLLDDVNEVLGYTASYTLGTTETGVTSGARIRGFDPVVLRDGFSRANPPDTNVVSRVEVIRGPQAVSFGRGAPGGIINAISKRPRYKSAYSAVAKVGEYGLENYSVEATGPLNTDKLYYFANYNHFRTESQLDYHFVEKDTVAGALLFTPSPQTGITLAWEMQAMNQQKGKNIPYEEHKTVVTGEKPDGTPISATVSVSDGLVEGELDHFSTYGPNNDVSRDYESLSLLFEHRFTRDLQFRANLQYYTKDYDEYRWTGGTRFSQTSTGWVGIDTRDPYLQIQQDRSLAGQMDLLWRIDNGAVPQRVLFSANFEVYDFFRTDFRLPTAEISALPSTVRKIETDNPDWTTVDRSRITNLYLNYDRAINYYGFFTSHRAFLLDGKLTTMAGVRYDIVDTKDLYSLTSYNREAEFTPTKEQNLTYSLGANYKLNADKLVFYVSHSTSFDPQVIQDAGTGEVKKFEEGIGFETGFKGELFDKNLAYTLNYYRITNENVARGRDDYVAGTGSPQYDFDGEQQGEGVEFEAKWQVTRPWTVTGAISYNDIKVTSGDDIGRRLLYSSRVIGSVASTYAFITGPLKGFKLSASAQYWSAAITAYENVKSTSSGIVYVYRPELEQEAITQVRLYASYGWKSKIAGKLVSQRLTVGAANLLDEHYIRNNRLQLGRQLTADYRISF